MKSRHIPSAALALLMVGASAGSLLSPSTAATPQVRLARRAGQTAAAQTSRLRIVVIAGEDAVNIIQQKTAVAPIVEVRDRNNQPVAGALVTFTIGSGKTATFAGGAQTLSVTTNAAGRAVAAAVNPLSSGGVQIQVSAAFQGQTAVAAIAQTNVMTAAEAAAAASAGGTSGSGAAAGAGATGGGGGGLSGATIGTLAAAAGGGALVALKAARGPTDPTSPTSPISTTYSGSFTAQMTITTVISNPSPGVSITCEKRRDLVGTLTMTLQQAADGTVTGTANATGTQQDIALTASQSCQASFQVLPLGAAGPVTGTSANLGYNFVSSGTGPPPQSFVSTDTTVFSGALSNGVISGTLTITKTGAGQSSTPGGTIRESGTTTFPVTLR